MLVVTSSASSIILIVSFDFVTYSLFYVCFMDCKY